MKVLKTLRRSGVTLSHGRFTVRETVLGCAEGCGSRGMRTTRRSAQLAQLLIPRGRMGYDLMTHIGIERFVHHRQRNEIQDSLLTEHGIRLSTGKISRLAADFLFYLELLHKSRANAFRELFEKDGGWPMHVDATGEDGRGTLLVVYNGWRHWAMGAWKIPTERGEAILPKLIATAELFGPPAALMRDLGKAVAEACTKLAARYASKGIRIRELVCHMHLLRDIGKDLLAESHEELHDLFRRFEVLRDLRAFCRGLGRHLGCELGTARMDLASWLEHPEEKYLVPSGKAGLAIARALAQWVLDYPAEGNDEGFPFDLPWLDLLSRCRTACRALEAFLDRPYDDQQVHDALRRLHAILTPTQCELPFARWGAILSARAKIFGELRDALRPQVKLAHHGPPPPGNPGETLGQLRGIKEKVTRLIASLRRRRPARGPAADTRQAIDLTLDHLARHRRFLWGHAIPLPKKLGGGVRLADRTDNCLEQFFKRMKHDERRRSGRKILSQDFECLPPAAALAQNLKDPNYVRTLCGGTLNDLPAAFSKLDAKDRTSSVPSRARRALAAAAHEEIITSSLPSVDRKFVRSKPLVTRIADAARSRSRRLAFRDASHGC
jgi:hypothetical protein